MKKPLIIFVLLLFIPICSCSSISHNNTPTPTPTPTTTSTPSPSLTPEEGSTGEEASVISGTVYDASMNTLTLITDHKLIYSFEKDSSLTTATKDGILIGFPVSVEYYGKLDVSSQLQKVKIKAIKVSNFANMAPEEHAKHLLMVMTLDEKVGQMFIVRCPDNDAAQIAAKYHLGGYILFSKDFKDKTKKQVVSDIESYQNSSSLGMLIGVDEEGGTVNRISLYPELRSQPFKSPQELYKEGSWSSIIKDTKEKCSLLKELGINVNFAPVCDVSTNKNDFMYKRAFGMDAAHTSKYVEKVASTMSEYGIGCVLKHFPGYGSNSDTHTGSAYDTRPYSTFTGSDFLPFKGGIAKGADAVLVCHNIVECMDKASPASLSPEVHRILREELGFNGVIITDDLYMDAIKQYAGVGDAAVKAVIAGNDLLCCSEYEIQVPAVIAAAKDGTITEDRIDDSVMRILEWKIRLGII